MPFGISSAAEVMQKRNEKTFGDICDVHMVANDMIIASETKAAHDATLLQVMTRAQEKGVKFNKIDVDLFCVNILTCIYVYDVYVCNVDIYMYVIFSLVSHKS